MITSRLTSKAQTTVPQAIRIALHLQPGDEIAYEIHQDRVLMSKAPPSTAVDDPFMAFHEWDGEADHRAYAEL